MGNNTSTATEQKDVRIDRWLAVRIKSKDGKVHQLLDQLESGEDLTFPASLLVVKVPANGHLTTCVMEMDAKVQREYQTYIDNNIILSPVEKVHVETRTFNKDRSIVALTTLTLDLFGKFKVDGRKTEMNQRQANTSHIVRFLGIMATQYSGSKNFPREIDEFTKPFAVCDKKNFNIMKSKLKKEEKSDPRDVFAVSQALEHVRCEMNASGLKRAAKVAAGVGLATGAGVYGYKRFNKNAAPVLDVSS